MESTIKNLFVKEQTHGFTVQRHVNWDFYNWVAITPKGSIVVFKDRTDSTLCAVYSDYKGKYHVHIPYAHDIIAINNREKVKDVMKEIVDCLHYAECYIMRPPKGYDMVYNMNDLLLRDFVPFGINTKSPFKHTKGI